MKRSVLVKCLLAASILGLVLAPSVFAGFQLRREVRRLTWNGWRICEREGRIGVRESNRRPDDGWVSWHVLAPTVTNAAGRFIARDPAGKEPWLRLVDNKGAHANWTFEVTQRWNPTSPTRCSEYRKFLEGRSGFRFRMRPAEGPFKDWYVGVAPLPAAPGEADQAPGWVAAGALADMGPAAKAATAALEKATQDPNARVRSTAAEALMKVRP